jgi:hypothetical protein
VDRRCVADQPRNLRPPLPQDDESAQQQRKFAARGRGVDLGRLGPVTGFRAVHRHGAVLDGGPGVRTVPVRDVGELGRLAAGSA